MIDKLPGRILSCDKFSHFSIKIGNNMTHIDFNLTVILIYILLVNLRHTLLTLNMRGYAVILILFLAFGRQKFTSAIFDKVSQPCANVYFRPWKWLPDILKINSIFSIPCALFVYLSRLSSFTRSFPKICRVFSWVFTVTSLLFQYDFRNRLFSFSPFSLS